jgi:hypothetical protein
MGNLIANILNLKITSQSQPSFTTTKMVLFSRQYYSQQLGGA